jgi:hypothetical protein
LQAGFLAPLMLGTPAFRKRKKVAEPPTPPIGVNAGVKAGIEKQVGEGPEQSGTFRRTR